MNIPLLALTVRSMREDARSFKTHLWRGALVAALIFVLMSARGLSAFRSAQGLEFFSMITILNFFLLTFFAGGLFASAITEEKESGSLGLLKLTGLSPLSILLGKSAGLYLTTGLLLAIQLPFTLLAVTFGGISPRQIVAAYMLLAAYSLFIGGLGLLGSVLFDRAKAAGRFVFSVLAVIYIVPPVGSSLLGMFTMPSWSGPPPIWAENLGGVFEAIRVASAFDAIREILGTGFAGGIVDATVLSNAALGLVCFMLAWWSFERATRTERPPAPPRPALIRRVKLEGRGWATRAWADAVAWKDFRFIAGGAPGLFWWTIIYGAAVVCPIVVIVWFSRIFGEKVDWEMLSWVALWVPLVLLPLQAGMLAGKFLNEEMRWGTIGSLAVLPMTIGSAAYSKARGVSLQLLPGLAWLAAGFIWCAAADGATLIDGIADMLGEVSFWYGLASLIFIYHAAAWLSLYVKRGAFALTVAGYYLGNSILGALFFVLLGNDGAEAFVGVMTIALFVGSFLLHPWIGRRLESLAAAEG